jgi:hypothetical protein
VLRGVDGNKVLCPLQLGGKDAVSLLLVALALVLVRPMLLAGRMVDKEALWACISLGYNG